MIECIIKHPLEYELFNHNYKENLKKQIKKFDVISFDIFDTLLCRPYINPIDVFKHMEQIENCKGFAIERIDAERRARKKFKLIQEVNYDEIYDEIDEKYRYLKQKELDFETQILFVHPEMKEIYDYALSLGKRIIIISDMYLSEEFLSSVLKSKGYNNFEKLYVSSEYRKNKHSCELFKIVLNDLKLDGNKVLHIGDNHHSDFKMAKFCGLNGYHYPLSTKRFFEKSENHRFKKLYEDNKNSLTISIILGMLVRKSLMAESPSYWDSFGYIWGGPIAYGFTKFLLDEINTRNIKEAVFVARDGYTLEKIFNIFQKGDIKTHYVYSPRLINLITNFNFIRSTNWKYQPISVVRYYIEQSEELKQRFEKEKIDTNSYEETAKFVYDNMDILEPLRQKEEQNYKNYLKTIELTEKNLALVDISAGAFNSFKLLSRMLPKHEFYALYWIIAGYADTTNIDCKDFQNSRINGNYNSNVKYLANYELLEFLITAPEYPISTIIENKPVYIQNKYEKKRVKTYKIISVQEIDFAKDIKTVFSNIDVKFKHNDLLEFVDKLVLDPVLSDVWNLSKIYHGTSEDHKTYFPLMTANTKYLILINLKQIISLNFIAKVYRCISMIKYYSYS